MNKVLIIAYYFPPMGLGGILRPLKFAKHLMDYNWQPVILTDSPKKLPVFDDYLLKEAIDSGIIIERTGERIFDNTNVQIKVFKEGFTKFNRIVSSIFFIPDSKIKWKSKALKKADEIWEKYNGFNLVLASAPPYTDLLIGQELKKKYKVPLVTDYRNAWVDNGRLNYYPTPLHRMMNVKLEKAVVRDSNKILTTNRRIKELILKRYGSINYEDIILIPHSYYNSDLEEARKKNLPYTTKMRITYVGSKTSRGLNLLFKSVRSLLNASPLLVKEIEFLYLGVVTRKLLKKAKDYGILEAFYMPGFVNHHESVKYILASDILFLHIKRHKNDDAEFPGVLGDYIGSRKNILAAIPEGVTKNILTEYGASKIVTDYNPATIAEAMYDYYILFNKRKMPVPNEKSVEKFDGYPYIETIAREFNYLLDVD
jgi:hypothetical protein